MRRTDLNVKLQDYAKSALSPTQAEQRLVNVLFGSVRSALGESCFLIGSYPRFIASTPLHDIDIMFVAGKFDPSVLNPRAILTNLQDALQRKFRNPTTYEIKIMRQTHSITISFLASDKKQFAIDIVPAFTSAAKNEFGDDIFWVPEILETSVRKRASQYVKLMEANKAEIEWWLKSDPLGYIRISAHLNALNNGFRKTTKFIKAWKYNCEAQSDEFTLKSFHIEQVLLEIYRRNPGLGVFDALFGFFCDVPNIIARPQIRDRADPARFIDDYVKDLTQRQRRKIVQARDCFLIKLENIFGNSSVASLLQAGFHERASDVEEYLFDSRIPVLLEKDADLRITAQVLPRPGFRGFVLNMLGLINVGRRIQFRANLNGPYAVDLLKWKVKNDDRSPQPRGEITDHRTRNDPESTKYNGSHFVECYGVKDRACIARARQNVVLRLP